MYILQYFPMCECENNDVRRIDWKVGQGGQSIAIGMDCCMKWRNVVDGGLPSPMQKDLNQQVERCMVCLPLCCTSVPGFAGFLNVYVYVQKVQPQLHAEQGRR